MKRIQSATLSLILLCLILFTACRQQHVIKITDFGAIPDDGKDDSEALAAALKKAASLQNAILVFPTGQYDFIKLEAIQAYESMIGAAKAGEERWAGPPPQGLEGWPDNKNTVIRLENLNGLTIDGQGSVLMFHGLCQAICIQDCNNCCIKNLKINYLQPPFMTGEVTGVGETWIDVHVTNKEVKGGEPFIALQMYDPETLLPTPVETFAGVQSTERLDGNVLRLHMTSDERGKDVPQKVKIGSLLVMRHILGGYEPIEIREGKNILLENIKLSTGAGMGILGVGTENLTLRHVDVVPANTADIMSTTADGTHFVGCRGKVVLDSCTLIGEGDDHFNLHGQYHFVEEIVDSKTIKSRIGTLSGFGQWTDSWVMGWTSLPRIGETVEFCRKNDLNILGEATIKTFRFDKQTGRAEITFENGIPKDIQPEFIFQVVEQVPAIRITNCRFGPNRSRGILLTSRDIVAENNTFEQIGGTPIFVCCEVDWMETPAPANVTLRNNTIRDCGYAVANEGAAITLVLKQGSFINGYMENVNITGNRISGTSGAAIKAQQIKQLNISGNDITGFHPAIIINKCKDINIKENTGITDNDITITE